MKTFSRTDKSVLGRWWWTVDHGMLTALITLMIFGIAMVTAASPPVAERIGYPAFYFLNRHLIFLVPSLVVMLVISMIEARWIWRISSLVLAGGILLMITVLLSGAEVKGAQRWISIFGFSIQPSEFVKPAFAVVAAWLISWQKEKPDFPAYVICALLYFLISGLLLKQPDLGMTVVITAVLGVQVFLAGLPFRYLIVLILCFAGLLVTSYFTFGHVESRIDRFLDPDSGDSYQVDKALSAFRNGGVFGTGPGQGEVKLHIPDAHSDFIFSVAGEELGLFFIAAVTGVYAFILIRGFARLMDSNRLFSILAAGGILAMFGLQSLVHMGTNVNIMPTKGMTLPFISYGGSSLMASAFGMGMVLALTRRQPRSGVARGGLVTRTGKNRRVDEQA